jgi:uncharacterized repeat protein (TIGR01451 family)
MAQVNLVPSVTGPTELQLNEHEAFVLKVQNTGLTAASNVVARMALPAGTTLAAADFPSYCFEEALPTRSVRCNFGNVGRAGASNSTKTFRVVLKAPSTAMTLQHSMSATNAGQTFSAPGVTTAYAHYDVVATPGNWASTACGGSGGAIAYDICPPGSIRAGTIPLNTGGTLGNSTTATWTQTSPRTLEMFTGTTTIYMAAINSKCFRGRSTSPYSSPYTTSTTWYTANMICKP